MACAARPVRAVDAVGAGDAFAVTHRGDWEGLPRRSELPLLDRADGTVLR
jgi:2-dehydro-3-deoxygluconokinase